MGNRESTIHSEAEAAPPVAAEGGGAGAEYRRHGDGGGDAALRRATSRVSRRDMVRREIDFLDDAPSSMTCGRRAALRLMRRHRWYNPRLGEELVTKHANGAAAANMGHDGGSPGSSAADYIEMSGIACGAAAAASDVGDDGDEEGDDRSCASFNRSMLRSPTRHEQPSLARAWAYFEHVTLPRYLDHSATTAASSAVAALTDFESSPPGQKEEPAGPEEKKLLDGGLPHGYGSARNVAGAGAEGAAGRSPARLEKRNHLLSRWATQQGQQRQRRKQEQERRKQRRRDRSLPPKKEKPPPVMDRAEPGEDRYPTRLYSPLGTPMDQMGDFGLGVGLYFSALRSITILSLVAGLINIPNMVYFASTQYSNGQEGVDISLRGSAVCTVQEYVPCPMCTVEDFADNPHRIATTSSYYGDEDLVFVLKNFCDGAKLPLALVNYATLLFIIAGMVWINMRQKEQEVLFDEDEQTAQDYSIVAKNPPPDATKPEEWKAFFEDAKFGPGVHVTCCTIARDNYLLVRALVRRREILQRLKWKLPPGTILDVPNLTKIVSESEGERNLFDRAKSLVSHDVPSLVRQLKETISKVEKLSRLKFPATRIFVTFETEAAQRAVLKCLSAGSKTVWRSDVRGMDPDHLFRSRVALNIKEAAEPSTIRWEDLSDRPCDRLIKLSLTAYAWACSVALVAFIVEFCRHRGPKFAAYAIAFFNGAFPEYAKILVKFESHPSEGLRQTSLYIKIAAFRWINTAIIITMATPFTSTLSHGNADFDNLLDGVCAIFFAEIVTTNVYKFVDPMGFVQRHYLAPRAASQEEMNSYMRGEEWFLAERYSNMSKIFFLALWYSSFFPMGFFFCALAMLINQFSERYSIMRTWRQAPRLGLHTSSFSRRYVFTSAIAAMAIASSYSWAGFPYDNLCENDNAAGSENDGDVTIEDYIGTWDIVSADGSRTVEVTVSEGDPSYRFCKQSLYWYGKGFNFPAVPYWQKEGEEWMTDEQELLTTVYGWTSFYLLIGLCLWILKITIQTTFFRSKYEPCGEDQGIPFSDVATISSYVPEVKSEVFSYPLLAVDTEDVDEELYEWKDPSKPYSYYDLTRDAREILKGSMPEDKIKSLFSTIKHWPPDEGEPKAEAEEQEKDENII